MHPNSPREHINKIHQSLQLIAVSCITICIYLFLVQSDVKQLEQRFVDERLKRREAEELARIRSVQMDQALEQMHRNRQGGEGDDKPAGE